MEKEKRETIKLKNAYFEQILKTDNGKIGFSPVFLALCNKDVFEEFKPQYWLDRILERITQEAVKYSDAKRKRALRYTRKHEADGEERDKDGKVVRRWKKGDSVVKPDGTPEWEDFDKFMKDFQELLDIEIDLGFKPLVFDYTKRLNATAMERRLLMPLLAEPPQE